MIQILVDRGVPLTGPVAEGTAVYLVDVQHGVETRLLLGTAPVALEALMASLHELDRLVADIRHLGLMEIGGQLNG